MIYGKSPLFFETILCEYQLFRMIFIFIIVEMEGKRREIENEVNNFVTDGQRTEKKEKVNNKIPVIKEHEEKKVEKEEKKEEKKEEMKLSK